MDVLVEPEQKALCTDANAPGYGWDQVAGVVHSAYRPPATVAEETAEEPVAV
ncbi:hypothetical protein [Kocuria nitroreducens]|uniref:hypothetical protein n=1 Tax=Kocuria nitroreducens TaxID=3058914 RepID=UPI0036DF1EDC